MDIRRRQIVLASIAGSGLYLADRAGFRLIEEAHASDYKIPGAIMAQEKKFPNLADAWWAYHTKTGDNENRTGEATAEIIMNLVPGRLPTSGRMINKEKALMESYGYHLLGRKMGNVLIMSSHFREHKLKPNNPQLYYFSIGAYELYRNHDTQARENFAKGIFAAAQLTPADFKRLNTAGIDIQWQGEADEIQRNASILGRKFVSMGLEEKEKVLNIGIGKKKDYDMEGVYWNHGFFINREYVLNPNLARKIDREENKNGLYSQLFDKYKFDTMTKKLIL